jgi:methionyl-tRNA formyltransferase
MNNNSLKIVFMGTPEFAVASLEAIHKSRHIIKGVVTVPDKPAGRGKKLKASAVKEYAVSNNLPLLQPEKLKNPDFLSALAAFDADVFVVVAFRMLPEQVWAMPPKGTFNLHASLLPQYRGAAPINHAIINGETRTGVTTFFIDKEIDTGKIIMQKEVEITATDNAGSLHDKLMTEGASLTVTTLDAIAGGNIEEIPQEKLITPDTVLKPAPKIFKDDCRIDWNKNSDEIINFIRGLSPYPVAFTEAVHKNKKIILKIYGATALKEKTAVPPGKIITDGEKYLKITTADGIIDIKELQIQGKKRMPVKDFLNGFRQPENLELIP